MQEKHVPMRKCIGCGEMIGKKGAVRIVRSKEGELSVDLTGKKPGRGAYLCRSRECLEQDYPELSKVDIISIVKALEALSSYVTL